MEYLSTDGTGRTTSTLQAWDWQNRNMQSFSHDQKDFYYPELNEKWAVVVGTSDTWANYRHQADALAMYQLLKRHGYDDEHIILIILSLVLFTLLGTLPTFSVPLNYITWFGIIYFIASYFRLYPHPIFERRKFWGVMTLFVLLLSLASVFALNFFYGYKGFGYSYYLLFDSNKIFAVAFAVCSFLWFKNMNIQYSKIINAFGAGTFGVLLIHANSTAMRTWLWKDTVDSVGHYNMPLYSLFLYSIGVVLVIFVTCNLIDQLRIATLEKWFFKWYDKKYATKIDSFVNGFIVGN
jgi:hypothetical protein